MRKGWEFFLKPAPKQTYHRRYEALRAFIVDSRSSGEVAKTFGYGKHSFEVLINLFRRGDLPPFFRDVRHGRKDQPVRQPLQAEIVALRQQGLSIYDIESEMRKSGRPVSHSTIWMVIREAGFARLPKRRAASESDHGTIDPPVADVHEFTVHTGQEMECRAPLILLFANHLAEMGFDTLAREAGYPGSSMIPSSCALKSALVLKLLQKPRKNHVMPLAEDEGLGMWAGLNVLPKKSFLSEYSSRVNRQPHRKLLQSIVQAREKAGAYPSLSFNLDFHTIRHYGDPEGTRLEKNYVPRRSQSVPSVVVAYAQEEEGKELVYANANLVKKETADEVVRFVEYWRSTVGKSPEELTFDCKMTTVAGLAKLEQMGVTFLTLRSRRPKEVKRVLSIPEENWTKVEIQGIRRKYVHPRVIDEEVEMKGYPGKIRQIVALDLGREEPMFLLTNDRRRAPATLLSRYPLRTRIENSIRDQVDAFHVDALSSSVRLKVDMDVMLDVVGSGCYRWLGQQLKGWEKAAPGTLWKDFLDRPGKVRITEKEVVLRVRRFSKAPVLLDAETLEKGPEIPWLGNRRLKVEVTGDLKLQSSS